MTDDTQPEALYLADVLAAVERGWSVADKCCAELRRLHAYCQELESQVIRDCMTHDQKPAEIEHVAGDVSKNGAEVNMAYAELPTRYYLVGGVEKAWDHQQMRDFADATHTLRASHGQASSQAGEYPALVCDYCGALTPDPWHSSGMLHGKMSKHIHSCDACAARGATQAQDTREPLPFTPRQRERLFYNRPENVSKGATMADWHRVVQYIEAAYGIKGGQHVGKVD